MTTYTDDSEITRSIIRHLQDQERVIELLGRNPVRVFPGDVPPKITAEGITPRSGWVNLEIVSNPGEHHFTGSDGIRQVVLNVVSVAATQGIAHQRYGAIYDALNVKWSVTWGDFLWVQSSIMSRGTQAPLFESDGSPSQWQQVIGQLELWCEVLPVSA